MRYPFESQERYTFLRHLGQGIFGTTTLVLDTTTQDEVVLNAFDQEMNQDPEHFRRQIDALARLSHPHLTPYLHPLREGETLGYIRAYTPGKELIAWVTHDPEDTEASPQTRVSSARSKAPAEVSDEVEAIIAQVSHSGQFQAITPEALAALQPPRAGLSAILTRILEVMPGLLLGLEHLHHYKRAHGLICPECLLVESATGQGKLADFGLSSWLRLADLEQERALPDDLGAERAKAWRHRALLYRAPELFAPGAQPSAQSDVYSMGCIFYELLTGSPPHDLPFHLRRDDAPPPLSLFTRQPTCPSPWAWIIERMLAPVPSQRPPVAEILDFLEDAPSAPVAITPTFTPALTALFDYHPQLEHLMRQIKEVEASPQPHTVMLLGSRGAGKAHMLRHLGGELTQRGWVILHGHCMKQSLDFYDGWSAIFGQLSTLLEKVPPTDQPSVDHARHKAAMLFPTLVRATSGLAQGVESLARTSEMQEVERDGTELAAMRFEATRALRSLLQMVGGQRPLLLILENIEFAPRDTLQLLHDLRADSANWRVMILLTSSDPTHSKTFPALTHSGLDTITLPGFSPAAAGTFLRHLCPVEDDPIRELQSLIDPSCTTPPMLLKELVHSIRRGAMTLEEVRAEKLLQPAKRGASFEPTLRKIYRKRLDTLSPQAFELLQAIALYPQEAVPAPTIESYFAAHHPQASVSEAIDSLIQARLIRRSRTTHTAAYQSAHDMLQTLVLQGLGPQEKQAIYERFLDTLAKETFGTLRFELLRHAERMDDAMAHFDVEFGQAMARLAFARASSLQQWFLDHQGKMSLGDRLRYKRVLANLEACDRRFEDAAGRFESCADVLAPGAERTQDLHDAALMHFSAGAFERTARSLQGALAFFGDSYLDEQRQSPLLLRAKFRAFRITRWKPLDLGTLDSRPFVPEQHLHHKLYVLALETQGMLNGEQALAFGRRMWRHAKQSGNRTTYANTYLFHAQLVLSHSMTHAALQVPPMLAQAQALYKAQANWAKLTRVATIQMHMALLQGKYQEATDCYHMAAEHWQQVKAPERLTRTRMFYLKGLLFLEQGAPQKVDAYIHHLLFEERQYGPARVRAGQLRFGRALLQGERTVADAELAELEAMVSPMAPSDFALWCTCARARLHLAWGQPEVALGMLEAQREQLQATLFFRVPRYRIRFELQCAQVLMTLMGRRWASDRTRLARYATKLGKSARCLFSLRKHASLSEQLAIERVAARRLWLHGKPQRALKRLEQSMETYGPRVRNALEAARFAEARSLLLLVLEAEGALELQNHTRRLYDALGIPSPLFLEGWPLPKELSTLGQDQATGVA